MRLHTTSDYAFERYVFLKDREQLRLDVYSDPEGIPTIGVGINLQVRSNLDIVLQVLGFDVNGTSLTGAALDAEREYIRQIRDAVGVPYVPNDDSVLDIILNNILAARRADSRYDASFVRRQFFQFNDETEARIAFDQVIPPYETQVDNWLEQKGITLANPGLLFPDSKERTVLVSLAYNGKDNNGDGFSDLLGNSLAAALKADDRAEAWWEIRYNSNGGSSQSPGIANRRYKESSLFNLYNEGDLTDTEAKSIYRMYTRHREVIYAYENQYNPITSGSQRIRDELVPARDVMVSEYAVKKGLWFDVDGEILVGEDTSSAWRKTVNAAWSEHDTLIGSAKGDLLFGESGDDWLNGLDGGDILYGGKGKDRLEGGCRVRLLHVFLRRRPRHHQRHGQPRRTALE